VKKQRSPKSKQNAYTLWTGPVAKTLERLYGNESLSPVSLFVARAREACNKAKLSRPPFDPQAYAAALDIEVRFADIGIDGTLMRDRTGRFVATVKRSAPLVRRNFTLAHEIAHTFFYSALEEFGGSRFRSGSVFDPEEERLCDIAAAEMLMPYSCFREDLMLECGTSKIVTPLAILNLSEKYAVSKYAAAIRIGWVMKNTTCVIWTRRSRVAQEWITPSSPQIRVCGTGETTVERAFRAETGEVITNIDVFYQGGGRIARTTSSLKLRDGKVLSVLQPPRLLMHSNPPTERKLAKKAKSAQHSFHW
jgi:Zn-dependent peptidase ImmA (M78 family)